MPIYEFECGSCGAVNEFTMKFSDPNPENCPECGKGPMQKLISRSAFQLKGGGWYTDAYDTKDQVSKAQKAKEDVKSDTEGSKDKPTQDSATKESKKSSGESKPSKTEKPTKSSSKGSSDKTV